MANDYLLKTWREIAYNQEQTQEQYNQFWGAYFVQEKEVYKDILGHCIPAAPELQASDIQGLLR